MKLRSIACGALTVLGLACGDNDKTPADAPPSIDAADPCAACDMTQQCVQRFGGDCFVMVQCVPRMASCAGNPCTAECEQAYCGAGPYQCKTRPPCGTEVTGAFTCYGP